MSKEDSKEFNSKLGETCIHINNIDEAKNKIDNILENIKADILLYFASFEKREYLSLKKQEKAFIQQNFNLLLGSIRHRLGGHFISKLILEPL